MGTLLTAVLGMVALGAIMMLVFAVVGRSNRKRAAVTTDRGERTEEKLDEMLSKLALSTAPTVPGRKISASLGLVRGITRDAALSEADFVLAEKQALFRMCQNALELEADAVISIQLVTGSYTRVREWNQAQAIYIGTAVKLAPENIANVDA